MTILRRLFTFVFAFAAIHLVHSASAPTPEILFYKFNGTGTSVPNEASAPPAGTTTATLMGGLTQGPPDLVRPGGPGGSVIGSGNASNTDFVNTGWAPNLTGSWSISFKTSNITPS